jgi:iron complex transport system ATP-binding protein
LAFSSGEIHTILGPNGIGKSTLLQCLIGRYTIDAGEVLLDDAPIRKVAAKQRAQTIAYVPQIGSLATTSELNVLDFLVLGHAPYLKLLQVPKQAEKVAAQAILSKLGLSELQHEAFSELSGGQQQLVLIARALIQKPKLIILDEPTSALDLANQSKILALLKKLAKSGYGILLTTHDPNQAIYLAGQVSLFSQDGKFSTGPMAAMISSEKLSQAYGVPIEVATLAPGNRKIVVMYETDRERFL